MKVVIDRDPEYAPCCYLICQVTGDWDKGTADWDTRNESTTVLVQSDWDFPGLASNLGFVSCECGETDGTIDCAHKTATQMITEAGEWLDEHLGEPFDDPGYFTT